MMIDISVDKSKRKEVVINGNKYTVYAIVSSDNIIINNAYANLNSTICIASEDVKLNNCTIINSNLICGGNVYIEDSILAYSDLATNGDIELCRCRIINSKITGFKSINVYGDEYEGKSVITDSNIKNDNNTTDLTISDCIVEMCNIDIEQAFNTHIGASIIKNSNIKTVTAFGIVCIVCSVILKSSIIIKKPISASHCIFIESKDEKCFNKVKEINFELVVCDNVHRIINTEKTTLAVIRNLDGIIENIITRLRSRYKA